jgi:hypothetical protein
MQLEFLLDSFNIYGTDSTLSKVQQDISLSFNKSAAMWMSVSCDHVVDDYGYKELANLSSQVMHQPGSEIYLCSKTSTVFPAPPAPIHTLCIFYSDQHSSLFSTTLQQLSEVRHDNGGINPKFFVCEDCLFLFSIGNLINNRSVDWQILPQMLTVKVLHGIFCVNPFDNLDTTSSFSSTNIACFSNEVCQTTNGTDSPGLCQQYDDAIFQASIVFISYSVLNAKALKFIVAVFNSGTFCLAVFDMSCDLSMAYTICPDSTDSMIITALANEPPNSVITISLETLGTLQSVNQCISLYSRYYWGSQSSPSQVRRRNDAHWSCLHGEVYPLRDGPPLALAPSPLPDQHFASKASSKKIRSKLPDTLLVPTARMCLVGIQDITHSHCPHTSTYDNNRVFFGEDGSDQVIVKDKYRIKPFRPPVGQYALKLL